MRHQGVIARYEAAKPTDEKDLPGLVEAADGKALVLVLDGVQDPHNLGACLRSAAAAGVTAVVIPKDKAAPINATVRKTSAGAADRIPVVSVTNLARTLRALQKMGVWIYGLDGDATQAIHAHRLHRQRRHRDGRRRRGHAPPHPRALRRPGEDPDAGRDGKPQRLGRHRRGAVRSGAPARSEGMSLQWFDFVGLAGVAFVLGSFYLLQAGKLASDAIGYQLANLFGAIFFLVSIFGPSPDFRDVISVTIMQFAWIAISIYGMWRGIKSRAAAFRNRKNPPSACHL